MPLIYFIAGMIFIGFLIPLLEGLLTFILTWLKKIETKQSAEIYKIKQTATGEDDVKKVVGFVYEEEEEEE